jgi:hypothetical protein
MLDKALLYLKNREGVHTMDNNQFMFCPYCGGQLDPGASFCKFCGKQIAEKSAKEQYEASQNQYYNTAEPVSEMPQVNYYEPQPVKPPVSKKNAIMSMIFGLIGLEFSVIWIYPIIGWIIGVPSIVFGVLAFKKSNAYIAESGSDIGFCKVGRITARIGFILTLVMGILSLIIFAGILSDPGAFDTSSFEYYYTAI